MCGIAGQAVLHPAVDVDIERVTAMARALRHRGPDDEGFFVSSSRRCALGMRRLAIIDVQGGQQPVFSEDRGVVCVLNGEIYNFLSLRKMLESKGHRFKSNSDTEVVVHLYEDEGVKAFCQLRGMFAIAIWDEKNERLVLARDRIGKKPLYYGEIDGKISFASEIQALFLCPGLRREVDSNALDLYLTYSYIAAPDTIYRSLRKLPPAHFMTVENGGASVERYWTLQTQPRRDVSLDEAAAALREKIMESVRLRMVSDVPIGCFLSGGVDSSIVAASMSKLSASPVKTFSIGFSEPGFDELQYARVVARHYGTEHHEYVVDVRAVEVLGDVTRHFGEPFGDSSALPTWYVAKLAREHVTVALNGDGGDEAFAGYPWYSNALRLESIAQRLPASLLRGFSRLGGGRGGRLRRLCSRLAMSFGERYASLRGCLDPELKRRLYTRDLLRACGQDATAYLAQWFGARCLDNLTQMQLADIGTYLPEALLVKVDRMSMAHSLEARSPFLDHELLELVMQLPPTLHVDRSRGKSLLREAVKSWFPAGFLERRKMGFSPPVAAWIRGELAGECDRLLLGDVLLDQGWFERDAIHELLAEHRAGGQDWSEGIWNLMMLAKWLEEFGP